MLIGALVGIPGASYLTALHILVTGKSSTAVQVVAVVVFVLIDFLLIIVPFVFLELRPEATKALLKHSQDWLLRSCFAAHGRHRPAPGRLPSNQRPGSPELTEPAAARSNLGLLERCRPASSPHREDATPAHARWNRRQG